LTRKIGLNFTITPCCDGKLQKTGKVVSIQEKAEYMRVLTIEGTNLLGLDEPIVD
jgi:hypothetical protein